MLKAQNSSKKVVLRRLSVFKVALIVIKIDLMLRNNLALQPNFKDKNE